MSQLYQIFLTAGLTVFGGILVLTAGQVLVRFFIEPIHELRKLIGEIDFSLTFFANLYANPATDGLPVDERRRSASDTLRQQASQLRAGVRAIPCYDLLQTQMPRFLAKREHLKKASENLIGLSNGLVVPQNMLGQIIRNNLKLVAEIRKLSKLEDH